MRDITKSDVTLLLVVAYSMLRLDMELDTDRDRAVKIGNALLHEVSLIMAQLGEKSKMLEQTILEGIAVAMDDLPEFDSILLTILIIQGIKDRDEKIITPSSSMELITTMLLGDIDKLAPSKVIMLHKQAVEKLFDRVLAMN